MEPVLLSLYMYLKFFATQLKTVAIFLKVHGEKKRASLSANLSQKCCQEMTFF